MWTVSESIKEKQLPVHSVSIEIYSGIARFFCDSTGHALSFNTFCQVVTPLMNHNFVW